MTLYNFRDDQDTKEYLEDLPSEAISIDGTYLDETIKGFRTLSITGRTELKYAITDNKKAAGTDGKDYQDKDLPERIITCNYYLEASDAETFAESFRTLKNFLQGDNRKLMIADEPNLYYIGTLETLDEPSAGLLNITSSFSFYCADPHATSDVEIEDADFTWDNTAKMASVQITNNGSLPAYPRIEITHHDENGYIGIVNTDGMMELGNREETDGIVQPKNEQLINTGNWDKSIQWKSTSRTEAFYTSGPPIVVNGSLAYSGTGINYSDDGIKLEDLGSGSGWHGGGLECAIPADSNGKVGAVNFQSNYNFFCQSTSNAQEGLAQLVYCDENDIPVCMVEMYKGDLTSNYIHSKFWVGNGQANSASNRLSLVFDWYYTGTTGKELSKYKKSVFTQTTGDNQVTKMGQTFNWTWMGVKHQTNVPALANVAVTKAYLFMSQFGSSTLSQLIHHFSFRNFTFTSVNVPVWKDVPNRYEKNDVVVIDSSSAQITHNQQGANQELVTGSEFLTLPPGQSELDFFFSSFMNAAPTLTITFKERYL